MIDSEECRSRTELDIKLAKRQLAGSAPPPGDGKQFCPALDGRKNQGRSRDHPRRNARLLPRPHGHNMKRRPGPLGTLDGPLRQIQFQGRSLASHRRLGSRDASRSSLWRGGQAHSQDISATDGGVHSWTNKDSLVSEVLDEAIFTLPVGQLSQILEDKRGFHIVRVVERERSDGDSFYRHASRRSKRRSVKSG